MSTTIKIKNSNVQGKVPDAGALESAELALNLKDRKLYSKDADGNVFEVNGTIDLDYVPAADKGTITNDGVDEVDLPLADGTNAGLMSPEDFAKLDASPNIDAGAIQPGTPTHGDLWVDTSACPPVLKLYIDEAECPGEGGWQEIEGGGPKPINPSPGDGNNSISPMPPGSGTELDPYVLTADAVAFDGTTTIVETISFSNQKPGDLVEFVDLNTAANGTRFTQPSGVIASDGTWSGKLVFSDIPETTDETVYTGLLKIGSDSIYYSWSVTVKAGVALAKPSVLTPPDGAGIGGDISYYPETSGSTAVDVVQGGGSAAASEQNGWQAVTYGNGKFVAVSFNGTNRAMYSLDGISWTSAAIPSNKNGGSVAYGDSKFVAVAYNKDSTEQIVYSSDAINWTATASAQLNSWNSVTYGDGKFVAVASDGTKRVMYSSNGINWSQASAAEDNEWYSVTYGDDKFVAVGITGTNSVMYSADGISWTAASAAENNGWRSVTYGNGKFVAVANTGTNRVMYSTNGINWDPAQATEDNDWRSVIYDDNKFVAVSANGTNRVMYSDDGINWNPAQAAEDNSWYGVTYGDGKFVAVSRNGTNRVMYSLDGTVWDSDFTKLTLTNDKAFNSATGDETTTIDKVFTAGTVVDGKGGTATGVLAEDASPSNPSITLTDTTGTWTTGMTAVSRTEATESGPGTDVVFTSSKPATTAGTVNTWGSAEWQLSVDSGFADKQEDSVQLQDVDVEAGPTSFTLEGDTEYWVRTRYNSTDPAAGPSDWSDVNHFKTKDNSVDIAEAFSTTLYAGNDGVLEVPTGVDLTGKSLVWCKSRTTGDHRLFSSEGDCLLTSAGDNGALNGSNPLSAYIAFGTDRFIHQNNNSNVNSNGVNYVSWNFRAAPNFFDAVTWVGNGVAGHIIPHALSSVPGFIIIKTIDATNQWHCWHHSITSPEPNWWHNYLLLNSTNNVNSWTTGLPSEPTSTSFTVGTGDAVNKSNTKYVAYLFADTPEVIKCGGYTGTGSSSNFIETGFKPGWVLLKSAIGASGDWLIFDLKRRSDRMYALKPNKGEQEAGYQYGNFSFEDNGFTVSGGGISLNDDSVDYIYVAIADPEVTTFYDENTASTVTDYQLTQRYGVDPLETDLKRFGVYPLTEQPCYCVDTYVKEGEAYKPIRNYAGELSQAQAEAAEANARLDERDQQLEEMRTAFEARISALEGKGDTKPARRKKAD